MTYRERRLPHWDDAGAPLFITFRLADSLPPRRVFPLTSMTSGEAFAAVDHLLDNAKQGPRYLARREVAELVVSAILDMQDVLQRYEVHAFVVMPNHVHLLATGRVAAYRWLGRSGAFWQDENYDHLVRSREEFRNIRRYIEQNPVRAELARRAEDYPWSGAGNPARRRLSAGAPGGSPAAA